jgi:hypothetical protein
MKPAAFCSCAVLEVVVTFIIAAKHGKFGRLPTLRLFVHRIALRDKILFEQKTLAFPLPVLNHWYRG